MTIIKTSKSGEFRVVKREHGYQVEVLRFGHWLTWGENYKYYKTERGAINCMEREGY